MNVYTRCVTYSFLSPEAAKYKIFRTIIRNIMSIGCIAYEKISRDLPFSHVYFASRESKDVLFPGTKVRTITTVRNLFIYFLVLLSVTVCCPVNLENCSISLFSFFFLIFIFQLYKINHQTLNSSISNQSI